MWPVWHCSPVDPVRRTRTAPIFTRFRRILELRITLSPVKDIARGPKTDGAEVGSPQTCADRWSRRDQQQGGGQHGMSREQMCPFVRAVNMSHSTLKMPEGHGGLYRGGRKWEGNKNVVGTKKKKNREKKWMTDTKRQIKPSLTEEERGGKIKKAWWWWWWWGG